MLNEGEFDTISSAPVEVPALGLTGANGLPPINALNYQKLLKLQQEAPDSFALLDALYTAANVPLSQVMPWLRSRAPLGTAYTSTLIQT